MIRDVTGLNEARDGSLPDKDALVGLAKMAANQSNIATKHINQASLYLSLRICENISLKITDVLRFPLTNNALVESISLFNAKTLGEISNLNLHDFGIFLELEPEEEEQQMLETNIQIALKGGGIDLEDAIDIRQIKNIKLANQLLKQKRKKKLKRDQANQKAMIQAQAQANAKTSEAAALAEVQKNEAMTQSKVQLEQAKSSFEIQRMQTDLEIKKQLMAQEFEYQKQLAMIERQNMGTKEQEIEDRKDKRIKLQGTQQSQLINQRQTDGAPKDFESAGTSQLGTFGLQNMMPPSI
tara:strand:- start:753 stop:1643 length:891 start_codon:yes stop_codon:yes gene_type:complete